MDMLDDQLEEFQRASIPRFRKIAIVTDAWRPQMNGVVRTLEAVIGRLREQGREVMVISPDMFRSIPCPTYPDIRLAIGGRRRVGKMLAEFQPDAIHLSTEGPLCWAARKWCRVNKKQFTTAYHTQFPQYAAHRTHLPEKFFWPYIKRFHATSSRVMVSTNSIAAELQSHSIGPTVAWGRGVDLEIFTPDAPPPDIYADLPRPIQLYVGRVAVEKNIGDFLESGLPGSKVVVGDGPALAQLKKAYPDAHFLGRKSGRELAGCYAGADVFVFPSRSDTFGLVNIEALACGTPVAAYPVPGPIDILTYKTGAMHEDLTRAITVALWLERADCIAHAQSFSWEASVRQFLDGLVPAAGAVSRTQANGWRRAD